MTELKTKPGTKSVEEFIGSIEDEKRRKDCSEILSLMADITGEKPVMWGETIVGFGTYHYKGSGKREADWFVTGFSPRKQNLVIYLNNNVKQFEQLLQKLGKHTTGSGCLYLKALSDVDKSVLSELIKESVQSIRKQWG